MVNTHYSDPVFCRSGGRNQTKVFSKALRSESRAGRIDQKVSKHLIDVSDTDHVFRMHQVAGFSTNLDHVTHHLRDKPNLENRGMSR